MIHVALASAYPTEAAAREAIAELPSSEPIGEYRGFWRLPEPYNSVVHLFSDEATEDLTSRGWTLVSSALPGDAPWTEVDA